MNFFGIASDYSLNLSVMNRFMFGYVIASISSLLWPNLLSNLWAMLTLLMAVVVVKRAPILSGCLFSLGWLSLFFTQMLTLPSTSTNGEIVVRAEIISLVNQNSDWISMDIRLLDAKILQHPSQKMRVSWQKPDKIQVGEQWQFTLKPKSITSVLNQGGFNSQRYFLNRHIIAKGRVITAHKLGESSSLRQELLAFAQPILRTLSQGDLIQALQFGDKSAIGSERWQALRLSGTGHLVSISGLHLTVVAMWSFGLCFLILKYLSISHGMRNWFIATVVMVLACIGYAALSGFALPTTRALIMLLVLTILGIIKRYSQPYERLLWALFLVLLVDPASLLGAGFWLSFAAISIIFSMYYLLPASHDADQLTSLNPSDKKPHHWRARLTDAAKRLWAIQWRLTVLMSVLQGILFGGVAPYSLLVNLLLVPYFSLVIIPACFALLAMTLVVFSGSNFISGLANGEQGFAMPHLANPVEVSYTAAESAVYWPARVIDVLLVPVDYLYQQLLALPGAWWSISEVQSAALIFCLVGVIVLFVVKTWRWRTLALALQLPLAVSLLMPIVPTDKSDWQLHMLDVGQGLSLVVQSGSRAIVYDTGAAFGQFSYAERSLLPFLAARGISEVDYLIVSHDDNDHAGGVEQVSVRYPDLHLISDSHANSDFHSSDCRPRTIYWQQLSLLFLLPIKRRAGNNGSCVLLLSDGQYTVLFTGDIEASSERQLMKRYPHLTADVLVVPHHGSLTSSTPEFVNQISPQLALVPAGYQNRYGLPKIAVMERYHDVDSLSYVAGEQGQVSVKFTHLGMQVKAYRSDFAPFWYNSLFEFGEIKISE